MDVPTVANRPRASAGPRHRPRLPFPALALAGATLLALVGFPSPCQAQTAPAVVSVSPADGATQVPTTSALVFVFDQDMDTSVPLFQSPSAAVKGNFEIQAPNFNQFLTGTWGADKRTLTLKPAIQFPYATFTWRLNPAGGLFPFKSKGGVPLTTLSGSFTTGVGGTAPKLGSTTPAPGASAVALDSPVVFRFDQVMEKDPASAQAIAWTGSGLVASNFNCTWSADGRSLGCDYAGDLPKSTLITWSLNPAAAPVKLRSAAGQRLADDTYSGNFLTAAGAPCEPTPLPPTWGTFTLFKSGHYQQTSDAAPVPIADEQAFTFGATVQGASSGPAVTSAALTWPDAHAQPLTHVVGDLFFLQQRPADEAGLDAAAPAGTYTLRFTPSGQPERTAAMPLPAHDPNVPRIADFASAQSIDAARDHTLAWSAFDGAGPQDFMSLLVQDPTGTIVFQAPDACVPRELPSTATSIVIPAGTLRTNTPFTATLIFNRTFFSSTNAVPLFAGFGTLSRSTQFTLRTAGGGDLPPPDPARFTAYRVLPNGHPELTIEGSPGRSYRLQRAGRPDPAAWAEAFSATVIPDAGGRATYEDAGEGASFPRFYRAVAP